MTTTEGTTYTCPHCRSMLELTDPGGWCDTCALPVLIGRRSSWGIQLKVWCAHCRRDHLHGRCHDARTGCLFDERWPYRYTCTCPLGYGDGHRVAHCHTEESPYYASGYIVVEQVA